MMFAGQFRHPRRQRGFTLIEVLITMSIIAIAMAIALPNFRSVSMSATAKAMSNDLVVSLNLARSEAVKGGADVSVTGSGADWSGGWTVQRGSEILQATVPAKPGYAVRSSLAIVTFNATGSVNGGGAVEIDVCPTEDTTKSRRINLSAGGAIRSVSAPASTCT